MRWHEQRAEVGVRLLCWLLGHRWFNLWWPWPPDRVSFCCTRCGREGTWFEWAHSSRTETELEP